jgi:hypothetical protein
VGKQPAAGERLAELCAFLSAGGGGEVAKPGKALQLLGDRAASPHCGKVEIGERERLGAHHEAAGQQSVAAGAVTLDMVARDRC